MYWIKTFGADRSNLQFHRLPTAVLKARQAFSGQSVVGFLICALERPPRLTGLLFCDETREYPDGLPIHTPTIAERRLNEGYDVFMDVKGGVYVVAHWLHDNGALDRFDRVH